MGKCDQSKLESIKDFKLDGDSVHKCSAISSPAIQKYFHNYQILALTTPCKDCMEGYHFYRIAIGADGKMLEIPTINHLSANQPDTIDILKLMDIEVDQVTDAQEALELVALYIQLTVHEFPSSVYFIGSAKDIGLKDNQKLAKSIALSIKPPQVKIEKNYYKVKLYTWSSLGGSLIRWEAIITKQGQIEDIQSKVLTEQVGNWGYEE